MNDPKTGSAPHSCPNCGAPAYVGGPGFPAQCTSRVCPFYSEDCWVKHVMELPDEDTEPGQYLDIEDEDTQPWIKLADLCGPGFMPTNTAWTQRCTPKQQKALDILEAAIDKMPVPYFKKPLDDD